MTNTLITWSPWVRHSNWIWNCHIPPCPGYFIFILWKVTHQCPSWTGKYGTINPVMVGRVSGLLWVCKGCLKVQMVIVLISMTASCFYCTGKWLWLDLSWWARLGQKHLPVWMRSDKDLGRVVGPVRTQLLATCCLDVNVSFALLLFSYI